MSAKRAAGTVQEMAPEARVMPNLPVARMIGPHDAMAGTAHQLPGKKPRVWETLHFAPNATPWNTPSLPCENSQRRRTARH